MGSWGSHWNTFQAVFDEASAYLLPQDLEHQHLALAVATGHQHPLACLLSITLKVMTLSLSLAYFIGIFRLGKDHLFTKWLILCKLSQWTILGAKFKKKGWRETVRQYYSWEYLVPPLCHHCFGSIGNEPRALTLNYFPSSFKILIQGLTKWLSYSGRTWTYDPPALAAQIACITNAPPHLVLSPLIPVLRLNSGHIPINLVSKSLVIYFQP